MFNFLKLKTDIALQGELQALCERINLNQSWSFSDSLRYEKLLREIYRRNLTPVGKLIHKKPNEKTTEDSK